MNTIIERVEIIVFTGELQTTAVCVQVNPGSIAERAGLQSGDAVLQINNRSSDELGHEQAKQEIVASGNNVILIVQRYDMSWLFVIELITCVYHRASVNNENTT